MSILFFSGCNIFGLLGTTEGHIYLASYHKLWLHYLNPKVDHSFFSHLNWTNGVSEVSKLSYSKLYWHVRDREGRERGRDSRHTSKQAERDFPKYNNCFSVCRVVAAVLFFCFFPPASSALQPSRIHRWTLSEPITRIYKSHRSNPSRHKVRAQRTHRVYISELAD